MTIPAIFAAAAAAQLSAGNAENRARAPSPARAAMSSKIISASTRPAGAASKSTAPSAPAEPKARSSAPSTAPAPPWARDCSGNGSARRCAIASTSTPGRRPSPRCYSAPLGSVEDRRTSRRCLRYRADHRSGVARPRSPARSGGPVADAWRPCPQLLDRLAALPDSKAVAPELMGLRDFCVRAGEIPRRCDQARSRPASARRRRHRHRLRCRARSPPRHRHQQPAMARRISGAARAGIRHRFARRSATTKSSATTSKSPTPTATKSRRPGRASRPSKMPSDTSPRN